MQFTDTQDMVQHSVTHMTSGFQTMPTATVIHTQEFGEYGAYGVPDGVNSPFTILAGTRTFSPDDWEVFYLG